MRKNYELVQIKKTKENVVNNRPHILIFKNYSKREFFKFINHQLIEYDLTRCKGKNIVLTKEEQETSRFFGFVNL